MLNGYFAGVITLVIFAAVLLEITHPHLKAVTGIGVGAVVICAVLLPLVGIIQDIDLDNVLDDIYDGIDYDATDSAIELAFEDAVVQYVADEYGVPSECVSVRVDGFDISTLTAQRIYVTLSGKAVLIDYKRMEEELSARFTECGECEVSISIG